MRDICAFKQILHTDYLYQITITDFIIISSQLEAGGYYEILVEMLRLEAISLNILPKQQRMLTQCQL